MAKKIQKPDVFIPELITEEEFRWLGVDLDGTIAESVWPEEKQGIGKPLPGAIKTLQKLAKMGWRIVIYTTRPSYCYRDIERYCLRYKIPFREILTGKPMFKFCIDDRNLRFDGNWDKVLKIIKKEMKRK